MASATATSKIVLAAESERVVSHPLLGTSIGHFELDAFDISRSTELLGEIFLWRYCMDNPVIPNNGRELTRILSGRQVLPRTLVGSSTKDGVFLSEPCQNVAKMPLYDSLDILLMSAYPECAERRIRVACVSHPFQTRPNSIHRLGYRPCQGCPRQIFLPHRAICKLPL